MTARSTYLILDCGTENLQQIVPQIVINKVQVSWAMRKCNPLMCMEWKDDAEMSVDIIFNVSNDKLFKVKTENRFSIVKS